MIADAPRLYTPEEAAEILNGHAAPFNARRATSHRADCAQPRTAAKSPSGCGAAKSVSLTRISALR